MARNSNKIYLRHQTTVNLNQFKLENKPCTQIYWEICYEFPYSNVTVLQPNLKPSLLVYLGKAASLCKCI